MRPFNYILILSLMLHIFATKCMCVNVLATMYRGSIAAGGARLNSYPTSIKTSYGTVPVYPVAVYTDRVRDLKYKIIKLKNKSNGATAYGHIIDECADGDCSDNKHKARKSGKILVDVHSSMWKALKLKKYGIHNLSGSFLRNRRYTYKNSPGVKRVMTKEGLKGNVPNIWKI